MAHTIDADALARYREIRGTPPLVVRHGMPTEAMPAWIAYFVAFKRTAWLPEIQNVRVSYHPRDRYRHRWVRRAV